MLIMSMIPCTEACRFQEDGICMLNQCTSLGQADMAHLCAHFQPLTHAPISAEPQKSSAPEAVSDEEVP